MKKLLPVLIVTVVFTSCHKETTPPLTDVWIRIENNSGIILEDASVANIPYGTIAGSQVTDYKKMNLPVYSGYCSFSEGGQQKGAGYLVCGTPPPLPFDPGYYTFKVMPVANGFHDLVVEKR